MTIGKDGIDVRPFIETILGKADALRPSISPEMETALMHRMDPARLKKQALSQGLLAFAQKLGSTPGHFLQGMGQAAPVGVGTYKNEMEKGLDTRINTLDTINKGQRQDQSDALEAAQTKLKTGMAVNKYETDQTNAEAEAVRAVQKHQASMQQKGADAYETAQQIINEKMETLGFNDFEKVSGWTPESKKKIEDWMNRFTQKTYEALGLDSRGVPKQQQGITDTGGAMQEQTKTVDGVTYVKKNGKWFVQGR